MRSLGWAPIWWLPWWLSGKESICQYKRCRFDSWVGKIPWRRKWQPTPVFTPGESHGQRSLGTTVQGVAKSQTQLSENNNLIQYDWVLIKRGNLDIESHTHEGNTMRKWNRDQSSASSRQEMAKIATNHQKQGETHETDPYTQSSEGTTPTIALILDF